MTVEDLIREEAKRGITTHCIVFSPQDGHRSPHVTVFAPDAAPRRFIVRGNELIEGSE